MRSNRPLVSCLCLTYARPHLLREAVWSFLQQDYPHKELVILNDHQEHLRLDQEYEGVRLINATHRFANLGQKRNFSVEAAKGDLLLVWDDDDLYLPWRITETVNHLTANPDKWAFKPTSAWTSTNNQGYRITRNLFHSQLGIWRDAFEAVGGYTEMNSGQDIEFERRVPAERWLRHPAAMSELIYVYRWGNGVTHISGLGRDQPGKRSGWDIVAERSRNLPGGLVVPGFAQDYWQHLLDAAGTLPDVDAGELERLRKRLAPYRGLLGRSEAGDEA